MPITPDDLFLAARRQALDPSETWRRSAISRAYYAAFHRCREWEKTLPTLGSNLGPAGGRHQELINRLRNPAPECGKEVGNLSRASGYQLFFQRQRRVDADYELQLAVTEETVRQQLAEVQQILARCDQPFPAALKGKGERP
jgi:uncharacterized protein (UPF0332 family)